MGSLFDDPRPKHHECRKIGKNTYRIKVGQDYRVIYTIDDTAKEVEIFRVAHRKDAY
ncbi:MAG: type II toxin-antitoxin system RelE/ParE family toxin [Nitrospinae bacterium]|nr:type II toxin-antitoxin system RelE/ParE family toxin [Nitrospinota bacterium]